MNQTAEFTRTIERLAQLYPKLPRIAAIVAVNFSKERFRMQNWVDRTRQPWPARKPGWKNEKPGRAILVKTARLKRDPQVISVGRESAIVGTSRMTVPYAKVHNEGFEGTVRQTVKAHERRRFGKIKKGTGVYSVKTRKERTRTVTAQTGTIQVRTFNRTIKQKIPARRFMGVSAVMDRRIEREFEKQFKNALSQ